MPSLRASVPLAMLSILLGLILTGMPIAPEAQAQTLTRDGALEIGGRKLRCGDVPIAIDRSFPSEGAAEIGGGPGERGRLIMNPRYLGEHPEIVRVFVFYHECGHHHVGGNELGADCWAVNKGVEDGWLDTKSLRAVCGSFEDLPATPTHPSGERRCRNLDRCFATAMAKRPKPETIASAIPPGATKASAPVADRDWTAQAAPASNPAPTKVASTAGVVPSVAKSALPAARDAAASSAPPAKVAVAADPRTRLPDSVAPKLVRTGTVKTPTFGQITPIAAPATSTPCDQRVVAMSNHDRDPIGRFIEKDAELVRTETKLSTTCR
jgi:hypothetical protein